MTEYVQIGIGMVGVMFFFAYVAFKMLDTPNADKWHQVAALLLLFGAVVMSWAVSGVNVQLAADLGPTHDFQSAVDASYLVTVVAGVLLFFYFAFRIAFGTLFDAYKLHKNRGGGDR